MERVSFFFKYLVVLIEQYLVPFLFAIGFIFLIYALVYYFILGFEEDKRADGRLYLIKANVWFFFGLVVYIITAFLVWMFTGFGGFSFIGDDSDVGGSTDGESGVEFDVTKDEDVLPLPNVPGVND